MFLGIEIGGTKLQLGVGVGDGRAPVALERFDVRPELGAAGILEQIAAAGSILISRHGISAIGIGFGGPIDFATGRTLKSHQIDGWDNFPLVEWCRRNLGLPARLHNDCDIASLAEARFGAGQGRKIVFYVTVGTGIGGGLIVDGKIYRGSGAGAAEIGHLRPGLHADHADDTVESLASGWGISSAAQARIEEPGALSSIPLSGARWSRTPSQVRQQLSGAPDATGEYMADLSARCGGKPELLSAKMVAQAAADGNEIAAEVLGHATGALGWGIAQAITLLAPNIVVVGGGVSLMEESLFFAPLIKEVDRYVFPPLVGKTPIVPAALGEAVVVIGALAMAAEVHDPVL